MMPRMRPLYLVLGLLIGAAQATVVAPAAQGAAQGAESVAVRVGEHPGFSRIVFDWSRPVGTHLEQSEGKIRLRFDRIAELDLARFRADPPPEVSNIATESQGGSLIVTFTVVPGATTRLSETQGKTVLDVLGPGTPEGAKAAKPEDWRRRQADKKAARGAGTGPAKSGQAAAQPKPASSTPIEAAALPPLSEANRVAVSAPISLLPPAPVPKPAGENPAQLTAKPAKDQADQASRQTRRAAKSAPPKPAKPTRKPAVPAAVAADTKAGGNQTATSDRPQLATPATPESRSGITTAGSAPPIARAFFTQEEALVPSGSLPVLIDTSPLPGKTLVRGPRRSLRFDWAAAEAPDVSSGAASAPTSAPTSATAPAAAAFSRDGKLWLVFDRPPPGDLAGEIAKTAPELAPVALLEVSGATVLRFAAPNLLVPRLRREGTAWIVDLQPAAPSGVADIDLLVEGDARQAHVRFPIEAPGRIVSFIDPDLGGWLIVAPLKAAGPGVGMDREFPQFRVLASHQGLVLQPLSETLRVVATAQAVELRDDEGLIVSRGSSLALVKSNQATPRRGARLFELEAWRRGDATRFLTNKHDLQRALIRVAPEQIDAARLELAKFYFAHGLATEALSVLRLSEMMDSGVALDPQARLIKGAGEFLTEDFAAAARELFHPALAGEWEAELWRAALAAASQDWELAAAGFAATDELIAAYPRSVRARLRLWAVEAGLATGDMKVAERHLEAVRRDDPNSNVEAQIAYLVARGLYLEGDVETAAELWRKVAASKHASSRIRARLALLDLALEDGSTTTEQAIAELENLRFAWRGDRFEFALLQRLGDLYILGKRYRKGLRLLRRAAAHTPNSEISEAVAARMRAVFTGLFTNANDELPPLKALALFEEFKELTPPGEEGDEVILRLAERLVEIDLLDRAAGVLGSQVEYRLKGPAKAAVAARLARVHLLNQRPAQALQAIDASEEPGLTAELTAQRQRLRSQALLDLDRKDEALAALGADDDPETLRLRTQVLRRQKNWPAAVLVLERLVPDEPPPVRPLREEESKAVVDLAVALTMSGDRKRLRSLGETYKEAMSRGPHAQTFTLLVGDLGSNRAKSVEEELAGVAEIEAFMASYRKNTQSPEGAKTQ